MKFFALAATVAVAQAMVGMTCTGQNQCGKSECCGSATPSVAGSGKATSICNERTGTAWEDSQKNAYNFSCSAEDGAAKLGMGFAAVIASAFAMA